MILRAIEMEFLRWLESIRTDFLTQFIHGVNFTGDVLFFTIILPIIYWLFSKRVGIILSLTIFVSLFTNTLIKDIFQILRPFKAYDMTSIVDQSGYSFPSGHAQHSFTFWISLSLFLRNRWFWLFSIVMILLVGFARMYSGVHYPLDVLAGWIIGLALVVAFYMLDKKRVLIRLNKKVIFIGGILISLCGLFVYEILTGQSLDQDGAYQAAGLVLFALVGYVLESSFIRFEIKRSILSRICAAVLGLLGLLLIKEGVKLVLPEHVWSDFIRYGLLAFWTIYVAPLLFVTFKLAYRKL